MKSPPHESMRPYVLLKWAETADGFIARADGSSKWISGPASRELVHRWRSRIDAILVGAGTALVDNPHLTARPTRQRPISSRNPLRVVLAGRTSLPSNLNLFDQSARTLQFTAQQSLSDISRSETYILNDPHRDLRSILQCLYDRGVRSLLVEGGAQVLESFLTQGLWDEIRVFKSPTTFGNGIQAPLLPPGKTLRSHQIGNDQLLIAHRDKD